jgi:hypothetical protein
MSKLDEFVRLKNDIDNSIDWCNMIDKEQTRTTAKGVFGKVNRFEAAIEVNYQETDGAQNYHKPPNAFAHALNEVLMSQRYTLINSALELLHQKKVALAKEAKDEYEKLMREAGLS